MAEQSITLLLQAWARGDEQALHHLTPLVYEELHFALAARQMRRILVDHARRRRAEKRGGAERPLTLDETIAAQERPGLLCALDDALNELANVDERKARAIELRYFGGMSQGEMAAVLGVHENTVARDLRLAEAFLLAQMKNNV